MPRIHVIQPEKAEGELKTIYEELIISRGKLAEVHKIQSLNHATIRSHMALYMDIMFAVSPLNRAKRELLAVVVSVTNKCEYCTKHHAEALMNYWRDEEKLKSLLLEKYSEVLSEEELILARYARQLTLDPSSSSLDQDVKNLKDFGFSDRAILDIHLVVAYFNFVNRLVLGLGVGLEEEGAGGYKY